MEDALRRAVRRRVHPKHLPPPGPAVISPNYQRVHRQLLREPRGWLVTGAAGFIGSHLVQQLLALGQRVVGLDDYSTGHRSNLSAVLDSLRGPAPAFTMLEGDIRDPVTCRRACAGADVVLHHAAIGSVPRSIADPLTTNSVNVGGFVNMLAAARDAGVRRFVYASSSAVYGDTPLQPQVEPHLGRPLSPYAASKLANELYAVAFHRTYGLPTVGLRYFNVFGERQDPNGAYAAVIPRWISSLLSGESCVIHGDGETTRDFCHVANVVQANLLAAMAPEPRIAGQVYNIASGRATSLNTLFALLRDLLTDEEPAIALAQAAYEPFRVGDIRVSSASIDKARHEFGYTPTHAVAAGLAATIGWYVRSNAGRRPLAVAHAS